jgi:hypothetical protein
MHKENRDLVSQPHRMLQWLSITTDFINLRPIGQNARIPSKTPPCVAQDIFQAFFSLLLSRNVFPPHNTQIHEW